MLNVCGSRATVYMLHRHDPVFSDLHIFCQEPVKFATSSTKVISLLRSIFVRECRIVQYGEC